MGRLFDLLLAHMDAQPYEVKPADIARKIGVSRQTVLNWEHPVKLIRKDHLQAISQITGVPYHRVLDALLEDIGYLNPAPPTDLTDRLPRVAGDELRVAKRPKKRE
jgi:transcriptional regulator with XRE-family HTH domain